MQKYPIDAAVKAKPGERNLVELIGRFPQNGKGMKVFKKTWPDDCYWLIYDVKMRSAQSARMYGLHYWNGELQKHKIAHIPGVHKRGIWQFDVNGAFEIPEPQLEEKVNQENAQEEEQQAADENEDQE